MPQTSHSNPANLLLIVGDSTAHLGLFNDLKGHSRIDIVRHPNHISVPRKVASRLSELLTLRYNVWGQRAYRKYETIVILDTALARIDKRGLDWLRSRANSVKLILLNSIAAASPTFDMVRKKLEWFSESDIYTFDSTEAAKYNYVDYGLSYYSGQPHAQLARFEGDAYFVGGIKGGRGELVMSTFQHLKKNGVRVRFDCATPKNTRAVSHAPSEITWHTSGWIPYETVLERSNQARCLIEILQHGQSAQSLRYFEAVQMNKLLLTNNAGITELPFYDPKYMRLFNVPEDIDLEWLTTGELPNYGLKDEFSPKRNPLFSGFLDG